MEIMECSMSRRSHQDPTLIALLTTHLSIGRVYELVIEMVRDFQSFFSTEHTHCVKGDLEVNGAH